MAWGITFMGPMAQLEDQESIAEIKENTNPTFLNIQKELKGRG